MSSFHWSFNLILLASTIVSLSAVRSAIAQQDRSQPTPVLDQSFGTWSQGNPAPSHFLATHSTLLRNNKIVTVGGSSYNCCFARGKEEAHLYDIASGIWGPAIASPAPYGPDKDAFCSGHAHDDAGGVIFQGGLLGYGSSNGHGINNSARYDSLSGTWTQLSAAAPHWYPTLVAGVRDMFIFPGGDTGGGDHVQKLAYGTTSWNDTNVSQHTKATYPRVSLLPDGRFFIASPANQDRKNYFFNAAMNTLTLAGSDVVPESDPEEGGVHSGDSWKGTGALLPLVPNGLGYPQMRFALINGINSYVKDLSQTDPRWQIMSTRPAGLGSPAPVRDFANSTLLPTGQVFVSGGVRDGGDSTAIREAEVYDPDINGWLLASAATVPRNYHGVALLMPDGRVWTASSSKNHQGSLCGPGTTCDSAATENTEERVEIFTPWYYNRSDRPRVASCPAKISTDGGQYEIGIEGSQGTYIGRVVLMRAGSVTHSFDADQRQIQLDIASTTPSIVRVRSPYGAAAAPPGDYMLFALRSVAQTGFKKWVPSDACWTRVEPQVARHNIPAAEYQNVFNAIVSQGYRPVWVDGYEVGDDHRFNAIFTHADIGWVARHDMDGVRYQAEFNRWVGFGFRLAQVDSYLVAGQIRYAAIWEMRPGPVWIAYHGVNQATHQSNFNNFVAQGYRPVNISAVNVAGTRVFTALYDKASVGAFFTLTGMTESQYQAEFNNQVNLGKHLAYVNAFMENGVPKISAIWNQSDVGAWFGRHGIDSSSYQTEFNNFTSAGYETRAVAGYEASGSARFVALWTRK